MVEALRESILGARPSIHELGYHDALGYSTSTSSVDRILYIAAFADHVALGFFFGADLQEQERLRVGQGERMRHVKVTNLADAQWALCTAWFGRRSPTARSTSKRCTSGERVDRRGRGSSTGTGRRRTGVLLLVVR